MQTQTISQEHTKPFHAEPEPLFFPLIHILRGGGKKRSLTIDWKPINKVPCPASKAVLQLQRSKQYQAQQLNYFAVHLFSLKQRIPNATDDTQLLPKAPKYQVRDWADDKESLILLYLPVSKKP